MIYSCFVAGVLANDSDSWQLWREVEENPPIDGYKLLLSTNRVGYQ